MCNMGMIEFMNWLRNEMKNREISQADLSRRSGISAPQISKIYNGLSETSEDGYVAIAKGLRLPATVVLRAAGIIPKEPEYVPLLDEWNEIFYELTPEDREELLNSARYKVSHKKTVKMNSSRGNKTLARIVN